MCTILPNNVFLLSVFSGYFFPYFPLFKMPYFILPRFELKEKKKNEIKPQHMYLVGKCMLISVNVFI